MTSYVVYASVAVKWYLPEIYSQQAATLLNPETRIYLFSGVVNEG